MVRCGYMVSKIFIMRTILNKNGNMFTSFDILIISREPLKKHVKICVFVSAEVS